MALFGLGPVPAESNFTPESGFSVSGNIAHGSSITITGTGFGAKPQVAPVIWDMGAEVFIDGVENTAHAALNDGDNAVGPIYDNGVNASMSLDRTHRHSRIDRHYTGTNAYGNSFIQMGGLPQFDGSNASRQSFTSFKIRWPSLNPNFVDGANFTNLTGSFIEGVNGELGEAITITFNSQEFSGNILNVGQGPLNYNSTQLGIYSPILNITSSTTPFSIVGDVSGATADCDTAAPHPGLASGKLWRIIQQSGEGLEVISQVSNQNFWIESNSGGVDEINMERTGNAINHADVLDFTGWEHNEIYIDFRVGTALTAQWRAAGNLSSVTKNIPAKDGSTNLLDQWLGIHSFGYDATNHGFAVDYGELYVDSTPQRIVIGNNVVYADCTKLELQRPTGWNDTTTICTMNFGEFSTVAGEYLYVVNEENIATKIGRFN